MTQTQTQKTAPQDTDEEIIDIPKTSKPTELLNMSDSILDEIDQILESDDVAAMVKTLDDITEKPYTLADAMREGSEMTNQAIGAWASAEKGETCALSAAYLAVRARGLA